MGCSRGRGGVGRKLRSEALPCVPLVTFYLVVIAMTVAAPSVSATVQKPSSTDEDALQQIAKEFKRSNDLLSNNWSWFKVQLSGHAGSIVIAIVTGVIGVTVLYLVDRGRKRWPHWKSLMPRPLEDMSEQLLAQLAALGVQIVAPLDRIAMTIAHAWSQLAVYANEVADLRAQLAAALDRMATTTAYAWRLLAMHVDEVADLRAQLAAALDRMATTTAYAWRLLAVYVDEVADLRAQVAAALDRMATTTAYAWRQLAAYANQLADLRAQVADLRAQLTAALDRIATTTADAERKEEETNKKVEWLEARFALLEPNRRNNTSFWPYVESELVLGSEGSSH